jgi:hypothetical protein
VRRAFSPLLVSLEFPLRPYQGGDDLEITIWLINDRPEPAVDCQVEVQLWDPGGQLVERLLHPAASAAGAAAVGTAAVGVPAGGAEAVAHLQWTLPWTLEEGFGGHLTCRLWQGDTILAANEYDLGYHDGIRPTWRQRLWAWLTGLFVPS